MPSTERVAVNAGTAAAIVFEGARVDRGRRRRRAPVADLELQGRDGEAGVRTVVAVLACARVLADSWR